MLSFDEDAFGELGREVGFCLDNIRHPDCELKFAGRFYEQAAEALRAHAILRILIDAKPDKFSNDLVMSGQSRRAFLRRCRDSGYADYYIARSRTGSLLDAVAGDDFELAAEISGLSPDAFRDGDEYADDFWYQRYVGLRVSDAAASERTAALDAMEAAGDTGPRLQVCRALEAGDPEPFDEAFRDLLRARTREVAKDSAANEELIVAIGTKVYIEGVALLKLAQRAGIAIAPEYPMCPALAVEPRQPTRPADEFDRP